MTISGSISLHDPYSFDAHDGSGEQLRTVPVGGADTVSITFSEDVNVSAETLRVTGLYTGNRPTLAEFDYDIPTMTATWRFSGWALGDQFLLSLSDAVTDIEGNRLDGEWTNPLSGSTINAGVSEFPSGDGDAGGNFNFVMSLLAGDANLDLQVTNADQSIFTNYFGQSTGMLFVNGDFTGNGTVDGLDFTRLAVNWGLDLTTIWSLADLDNDFDVDDDDLAIFDANLGMVNPTQADGDLNEDGDIDAADLDLVFAQYGLALAAVA